MPRRCDGPSASAHSAATAGRQLADVVQVEVDAVRCVRRRVTVRPVVASSTVAAHQREDLAQRVAGLGGRARPVAAR